MRILHTFELTIAGCVVATPLSFAQTSSSGSTVTYQTPAKQHGLDPTVVSPAAESLLAWFWG
jgi:hypothetical protein